MCFCLTFSQTKTENFRESVRLFVRQNEIKHMAKNQKIDIRMDDENYDKLLLLSWFFQTKRSDYARKMIEYFFEHGVAVVDGVSKGIPDVIEQAIMQLAKVGLTMEDIRPKKKDPEIPEELEEGIKVFADMYAKQAKQAYEKHFGASDE